MDGGVTPPVRASVIIPTYNRAGRIAHCLDALRGQDTTSKFEVIVVDDGSTDDTLKVLAQFPEVRVIGQANAGPAAGHRFHRHLFGSFSPRSIYREWRIRHLFSCRVLRGF